jgi:hypothetical protein
MRLAGIAALVAMLVAALPAAAGRDETKLERRRATSTRTIPCADEIDRC